MRIFKDLDLVEQLGSGIPRILQAYPKDCFYFSENFLRITLPSTESVIRTMQDTMQDTMQVRELLKVFTGIHTREELQQILGLANRDYFRKFYLKPAIEANLIGLTLPDKPTSSKQQYFLTQKGEEFVRLLKKD
ncbi:hypothetical protein SAMN04487893_101402 [Myroides guanonis]|uniref:Filamentation induced by cAMP protein Fic-like C-terminal domain-containing protein n=2 Tax=Myroides guanonis TaxID=1150112 RepID=A0A1I3LMX2_9FLAO|nr:hypothetical protein SAMN04487893_101402 [Myroides guanonis]